MFWPCLSLTIDFLYILFIYVVQPALTKHDIATESNGSFGCCQGSCTATMDSII